MFLLKTLTLQKRISMTTHNDKNLKYESSKVEKNIFSENIFDNWDIDMYYTEKGWEASFIYQFRRFMKSVV